MVNPSKPDQVRPSSCTAPVMLVAGSPLVNVTLSLNRKFVAAPAEMPEAPPKVLWNVTRPVAELLTVKEAPTASPKLETAPETVVVPAPTPAASVRSCLPPALVVIPILPALESSVAAPAEIPESAATALWEVSTLSPHVALPSSAPTASPKLETAPETVVVPAP